MARKHKKARITLAMPKGDLGTGTQRQMRGTIVEPVPDDKNGMTRRRGMCELEYMHMRGSLDLRQYDAAKKIRDAHCRVSALTSGGPLKEQVDCTPTPDKAVAAQVDAQSALIYVTGPIPKRLERIVDHVCRDNQRVGDFPRQDRDESLSDLREALNLVVRRLGC